MREPWETETSSISLFECGEKTTIRAILGCGEKQVLAHYWGVGKKTTICALSSSTQGFREQNNNTNVLNEECFLLKHLWNTLVNLSFQLEISVKSST